MSETGSEFALAVIGSGGTGVMLLGDLLIEAAANCGLYGMLARSYGPGSEAGKADAFFDWETNRVRCHPTRLTWWWPRIGGTASISGKSYS